MSINYIGEHLLPGQFGQTLLWVSFISAALATIFYFRLLSSTKERSMLLSRSARSFYWLHVLSLIGVAVVGNYVVFSH